MKRFYVVMRGERQNPEDSYTAIVEAETSQKVGKKALKEFKTALGPLAIISVVILNKLLIESDAISPPVKLVLITC
jgi:hypothetical protein